MNFFGVSIVLCFIRILSGYRKFRTDYNDYDCCLPLKTSRTANHCGTKFHFIEKQFKVKNVHTSSMGGDKLIIISPTRIYP
jgi:hypothetical protein